MEQYHLYAYEALGGWHISLTLRTIDDQGEYRNDMIYRGDHVAIDEQDPLVRAMLILSQVDRDLNAAYRGELDTLAPRPAEH